MTDVVWGLLGPETLPGARRTRTLGLGAVVRSFNDLAVPGLGGVWFGKQLFLAVLGVAVAEGVRRSGKRVQNIAAADTVEALACWLALDSNSRQSDPRLRGARKLHGKTDLSFAAVSKPSFYVTQPMRQATVQALRALDLVDSRAERFNAFGCAQSGHDFIGVVCVDLRPHGRSVVDHLTRWAEGDHDSVKNSSPLTEALSPLIGMCQGAREFLRERLVQPPGKGAARRLTALNWLEDLRKKPQQETAWSVRPAMLDEEHWRDLHAGALFFDARDAAIALLDEVEAAMGNQHDARLSLNAALPGAVINQIDLLREQAQTFLDSKYDPSPGLLASSFCRECTALVDSSLLEMLVAREGRVLRLYDRIILPGAAFRGVPAMPRDVARNPEDEGAETEVRYRLSLPEGISRRVHNLFLLNLDLRDELNNWLIPPTQNGG